MPFASHHFCSTPLFTRPSRAAANRPPPPAAGVLVDPQLNLSAAILDLGPAAAAVAGPEGGAGARAATCVFGEVVSRCTPPPPIFCFILFISVAKEAMDRGSSSAAAP
eukprot:CAMPEP_0202921630 /NCGR_PEP_ID=MMETSP1392-20130828/77497_1 /ASSEMBLY_ACC=CAM_ASM_000868 /TAXON_ID=225041 /ORGANISM="Chlamydomonas chlamydogama, Strain SAG 11-48b" /LENGTH=107 /DNA_ID=CAMNT_0049615215 /DNA_START=1148 /DNA_END=1471 /DNA_ORIENTATION=+